MCRTDINHVISFDIICSEKQRERYLTTIFERENREHQLLQSRQLNRFSKRMRLASI